MLSVQKALAKGSSFLSKRSIERPRHETAILLSHAISVARETVFLEGERQLNDKEQKDFWDLVRRRFNREPMAYILGVREFWSLDFEVTPDTLIPRPDSELLVESALEYVNDKSFQGLKILDLGVGSGCLLVSLLKELKVAEGFGLDQSHAALMVARRNAERHGVSERAYFVAGSWGETLDRNFDVIVVNPPYIAFNEGSSLEPDILEYEPSKALFAGISSDLMYRELAPHLGRLLSPNGRVFVELGANLGEQVNILMANSGLVEIDRRRDLAGIERCGIYAF